MDFLNHRERGMVSIRFSSFLLYRNCKRLREFEEKEISSKAVEVTVNKKEEKSFVWISSNNSASVEVEKGRREVRGTSEFFDQKK
jgi:hypothetical protein